MADSTTTTTASSLTDLLDFMTQMKDFSFKNGAAACCQKIIEECSKCVLNKCWNWTDYTMVLDSLQTAYNQRLIAPLLIAGTGIFEVYVGAKGQGDTWKNTNVTFYDVIGAVVAIIVGSFSGIKVGMDTINNVVRASFWTYDNNLGTGVASSYLVYGGHSLIGSAIGLMSLFWTVMWLAFAVMLVVAPYYLAMNHNAALAKEDDPSQRLNNSYRALTHGFVIALASWGAALSLGTSVDKLVNFFDRQTTALSSDSKSSNALLIDIINHSIMISVYYMMSMAIAGSGYAYVYYSLYPEEME